MRWTKTFIQTLRDDPADAEAVSHKLMVRAALVRQLTAGVYSYLPLGKRAVDRVATIVREEMNRAGAIELHLPVMHPAELWQETGRFEAYGDNLCKFKDRKGHVNVLGPTHEEVITDIVRNANLSYRQLPINLYQVQVKLRDEARPRFGVVRTREFIMKDAYSFDVDVAGMDRSYQAMYDAYVRIFKRCGVDAKPVEADPGLIGGDVSHEFSVLAPAGEDDVVVCKACGYAANKEKAECRGRAPSSKPNVETAELLRIEKRDTPGAHTVDQVAAFLKVSAKDIVKTILFETNDGPLAVLVRGDHDVNPMKLARVTRLSKIEMASPETIQKVTGGPIGFSGPVGLKAKIVADYAVGEMSNFVTGANERDRHILNVNQNRDFRADTHADVRFAMAGDPCPKCEQPLEFHTGIEVGHVFKLGTKYSAKMHCEYLDEKGQRRPMIMGCYGIGVTRVVAAAIEQNHDASGIIWPKEIAPYHVEIVTINQKDEKIQALGAEVHDALEKAGFEVLWDDREANPGVKFADADLVGVPIRVTVGKRTIEAGTVDVLKRRESAQKTAAKSVPVKEVANVVRGLWNEM
jgi:prolyl-tRNA synthetase